MGLALAMSSPVVLFFVWAVLFVEFEVWSVECEVKLGGGGTPFSGILSEQRLLVMNSPAKE